MKGINRADKSIQKIRLCSESKKNNTPCIFISYQRNDEKFACEVSEYIKNKDIDVYFDLEDIKLAKQKEPKMVTNAITKGLYESNYMIVVTSVSTYKSAWVPFEIGFAYDRMKNNMKLLKHKNQTAVPQYLEVKEMLNNYIDLNEFLESIQKSHSINEVKSYSEYNHNPLNEYLD